MSTLHEFLELLGCRFQTSGQPLLVIRNFEGLPYTNSARDIDILTDKGSIPQRIIDVSLVCKELGIHFHVTEQHLDHVHITVSSIEDRNLELDLIPAFVWYGKEWLKVGEVFKLAQRYSKRIWTPCQAHECVITFCHSFLYGGHVKNTYVSRLANLAGNQPELLSRCLRFIFGFRLSKVIFNAMATQQWDSIVRFHIFIRVYVQLREFVTNPVVFVKTCLQFFLYSPLSGVKTKFFSALR